MGRLPHGARCHCLALCARELPRFKLRLMDLSLAQMATFGRRRDEEINEV